MVCGLNHRSSRFFIFPQTLRGAPHKPGKLASREVYLKRYLGAPHNLRGLVSWEAYLELYWGSSAQTPGQAEPVFTRPLVLRFRLRDCEPINRQLPQRASLRLERGALWRSLAQPCARNPRNVSVCRRGPAFSRRLH